MWWKSSAETRMNAAANLSNDGCELIGEHRLSRSVWVIDPHSDTRILNRRG